MWNITKNNQSAKAQNKKQLVKKLIINKQKNMEAEQTLRVNNSRENYEDKTKQNKIKQGTGRKIVKQGHKAKTKAGAKEKQQINKY